MGEPNHQTTRCSTYLNIWVGTRTILIIVVVRLSVITLKLSYCTISLQKRFIETVPSKFASSDPKFKLKGTFDILAHSTLLQLLPSILRTDTLPCPQYNLQLVTVRHLPHTVLICQSQFWAEAVTTNDDLELVDDPRKQGSYEQTNLESNLSTMLYNLHQVEGLEAKLVSTCEHLSRSESESQFYDGNIADKQPAEMKIGKKQGKKDLDDVGIERQRQLVRDQRARHAV
ncbi:hypothetical protein BLNAU_14349 [Blattamonas nauphoetae]|uniref:Uncharacterized protein n=1 Tax=Blattamonas nauphoetae TaxID=2049346 RepID=A0ABQ9XDX7_9EUKA|nr:hypothetical protein BLNAU_14349 [Blattamonas nauphoetae]